MSLNPNSKKPQFFGANLIGACCAVITSIPLAALVGSLFGDTYNMRVTIYLGLLLWSVIGACTVYALTYQAENQNLNTGRIVQWFISTWLWPIMLLMSKRRNQQ